MTRYEQGFMRKCAEHGVPVAVADKMLKKSQANDTPDIQIPKVSRGAATLGGAGIGAGVGLAGSIPWLLAAGAGAGLGAAMAPRDKETKRKKRLKGALVGALLGIPVGGVTVGSIGGAVAGNKGAKLINSIGDAFRSDQV